MASEYRLYFSDRGLPLVYLGPPPEDGYILTVENYLKWYDIYRVDPRGEVSPLPESQHWFPGGYAPPPGECDAAWGDHVPYPDYCRWLARTFRGYQWCLESLDMIAGRLYWNRRGGYE